MFPAMPLNDHWPIYASGGPHNYKAQKRDGGYVGNGHTPDLNHPPRLGNIGF